MVKVMSLLIFIPALIVTFFSNATPKPLTDNEVKTEIIREYLTNHIRFTGPCPCPDSVAADTSRCGSRSAWSRKPGTGVLCFLEDVKPEEVALWRNKHPADKIVLPLHKSEKQQKIDNTIYSYLSKYVIVKITNPDDLNIGGITLDDTKTDAVKEESKTDN